MLTGAAWSGQIFEMRMCKHFASSSSCSFYKKGQ